MYHLLLLLCPIVSVAVRLRTLVQGRLGRTLRCPIVPWSRSPFYRTILISSATLGRHGSIQGAIGVIWGIWRGISGCHGFRHEILLSPSVLLVYITQFLMLPHGKQHLTREFCHAWRILLTLPRDIHQTFNSSCIQQRSTKFCIFLYHLSDGQKKRNHFLTHCIF